MSTISTASPVAIHVYGKHINHTARSQFDRERRTETPFRLHVK